MTAEKQAIRKSIYDTLTVVRRENLAAAEALTDAVRLTDYAHLTRETEVGRIWTTALQTALNEHEAVIIPAAKTLASDPKIAADIVAIAELNTMANTAVIQSALPGMNNYWTPIATFCNGMLNGDVTMDNYKDQVDLLNQQLNASSL